MWEVSINENYTYFQANTVLSIILYHQLISWTTFVHYCLTVTHQLSLMGDEYSIVVNGRNLLIGS